MDGAGRAGRGGYPQLPAGARAGGAAAAPQLRQRAEAGDAEIADALAREKSLLQLGGMSNEAASMQAFINVGKAVVKKLPADHLSSIVQKYHNFDKTIQAFKGREKNIDGSNQFSDNIFTQVGLNQPQATAYLEATNYIVDNQGVENATVHSKCITATAFLEQALSTASGLRVGVSGSVPTEQDKNKARDKILLLPDWLNNANTTGW